MQEIHDRNCENHLGGHSLTHKVINQGYYWPKMFDDAKDYVKRCLQCQRFASASRRPPHLAQSLALHAMGVGRSWTTPPSTTLVAVPVGSHRLLHQIGRGTALRSQWATDCQVPLTEHSVASGFPTPSSLTTGRTLPASKWPTSALSIRSPISSPRPIILKTIVRRR